MNIVLSNRIFKPKCTKLSTKCRFILLAEIINKCRKNQDYFIDFGLFNSEDYLFKETEPKSWGPLLSKHS